MGEIILEFLLKLIGKQKTKKRKFFGFLSFLLLLLIATPLLYVARQFAQEQIIPKADRLWQSYNYREKLSFLPEEWIEKPKKETPKTKDNLKKQEPKPFPFNQILSIKSGSHYDASLDKSVIRVYYSFTIDDYDDSIQRKVTFSARNVSTTNEKDISFKDGVPNLEFSPDRGQNFAVCLGGQLMRLKIVNFRDQKSTSTLDISFEKYRNKAYNCK